MELPQPRARRGDGATVKKNAESKFFESFVFLFLCVQEKLFLGSNDSLLLQKVAGDYRTTCNVPTCAWTGAAVHVRPLSVKDLEDFEDLWTRSTQIVKFPINRFLPHKFPEGLLPQKITV